MSKGTKVVILIAVAVLVVGGAWWWTGGLNGPAGSPASPNGAQENGSAVTTQGNSDLSQDLAQIDSQMNGLASDSTSIDQGLSDQPVSQEQL